jgi:hypothetical protein
VETKLKLKVRIGNAFMFGFRDSLTQTERAVKVGIKKTLVEMKKKMHVCLVSETP